MTETCWDILGIAPTADEKTIKKAYALKLRDNKPDKNPAGFRALREAYEQALDERLLWETNKNSFDYHGDKDTDNADNEIFYGESKFDLAHTVELSATSNEEVIDKLTLVIEGNSYYFQTTELFESTEGSDQDSNVLQQAQQQLIEWHQQWQHCINAGLSEDENEDAKDKHTDIDTQLTRCLTEQFKQLTELPLDALEDYEKALIIFFDDHLKAYPNAYTLAKSQFNWHQYFNVWQQPEYPWYLLQQVEEGYCASTHFINKLQFQKYMAKAYPVVYQYWNFGLPYGKAPDRWQFFKRLWFPISAPELNDQINALQEDMLSKTAGDAIDNKQLNYPQLLILKQRLTPLGMVRWTDFVFIALGVGAVISSLALIFPYHSALYDYIGVVTVLSLTYLYWQLHVSYLINPEYNSLSQTVRFGWAAISLLLWVLSAGYNVIADYIPVTDYVAGYMANDAAGYVAVTGTLFNHYYGAHLAGCSALLALTSFMRPAHLKHILWMSAFCLILFTTILPWTLELTNNLDYLVPEAGDITPLVWLAPMLPVLLMTLGSYVYPLRWLIKIGKHILTMFSLGSALLAFILLLTGSDVFTSNYLLLTLLVLLFAMVLLFMLMFVTTNHFNEPDMF
ncbi:J domain-containing protein [Psychrobacter lutiphocae]|uniref:J domain-containing protein n=1 Tax=Psychrobacter lutiphocae TaxID=540500 RepID=UPI00036A95D1|nr:J domain-containing protein [Psychrobacter lutiphocae]